MAYADYEFYVSDSYFGTSIAEGDFPRLAMLASKEIDRATYGRTAAVITADSDTETIEKIKQATCSVADVLQRLDGTGGQAIQSESIGRASVSYFQPKTREAQIFNAVRLYLWDTELLYRGFTEDERGD